ncbi:hypothetical protein [Armatimonas rosea]|uniref:Uncharacterized protein n=1 Tax=Armatimonas rosea TaxID=685828 RepID=A0A7W9SQK9_ARMRO|nr:hypothetical protein [Armatimonas rosea]MBB6050394.1 hypothetical protein [Armatimonas rosea]
MNWTWLWWGLAGIWWGASLIIFSAPAVSLGLAWILGVTCIGLAVLWFTRLVVALHQPERRQLLVKEAVVAILMAFVALSPILRSVRFLLSKPALNAYAKNPREAKNMMLGLYRFEGIYKTEYGWLFDLGDSGLVETSGFLYCPDSPPTDNPVAKHQHWYGPWYLQTIDRMR